MNGSNGPPRNPAPWPGKNEPLFDIQSGMWTKSGRFRPVGRSFARTEPKGGKLSAAGAVIKPAADQGDPPRQRVVGTGVVVADRVVDRADQRQVVRLLREHRQVLAEQEPRHRRRDRPELAPDAERGVGLHIPEVLMRGAPLEDEQDHRLGPHPPLRPRLEQAAAGSAQPEQARRADPQHVAPAQAVAEPPLFRGDPEHGWERPGLETQTG